MQKNSSLFIMTGFNAPTSLYRKERRHFISCQSISEGIKYTVILFKSSQFASVAMSAYIFLECHDNLDANQPSSTEAMHVCHGKLINAKIYMRNFGPVYNCYCLTPICHILLDSPSCQHKLTNKYDKPNSQIN